MRIKTAMRFYREKLLPSRLNYKAIRSCVPPLAQVFNFPKAFGTSSTQNTRNFKLLMVMHPSYASLNLNKTGTYPFFSISFFNSSLLGKTV